MLEFLPRENFIGEGNKDMPRGIVEYHEAIEGTDYDLVARFDETSILKRLGSKAAKNYSGKASEFGNTIIASPTQVRISLSYYHRKCKDAQSVERLMYKHGLDGEGNYTIGVNPAGDFKVRIELNFAATLRRSTEESQARTNRIIADGVATDRGTVWVREMWRIGAELDCNNPFAHLPEPAPRDHQVTIPFWPQEGSAQDAWCAEWDAWATEHLRAGWHFKALAGRVVLFSQSQREATAVKLRWG